MPNSESMSATLSGDPVARALLAAGQRQAACLALAAARLGVRADMVRDGQSDLLRLDLPEQVAYCRNTKIWTGPPETPLDGCTLINGPIHTLTQDKHATKVALTVMGFSCPEGAVFAASEEEAAVNWFRSRSRTVCLKPLRGTYGLGILTDLATEDSLRHAFAQATRHGQTVLLEEQVCPPPTGPTPARATFRFFYVFPHVVAVRMDLPANVTGDGQSDIRSLIARKNTEKERRCGHPPVQVDAQVTALLARQGLSIEDCPPPGQRILLKTLSNAAQSGDSHRVPDGFHPSYTAEMQRMFRLLRGLKIGAADVVLLNHAAPCTPDTYRILEINSSPGMVNFHFPWDRNPQDVASSIISLLLYGETWANRTDRS